MNVLIKTLIHLGFIMLVSGYSLASPSNTGTIWTIIDADANDFSGGNTVTFECNGSPVTLNTVNIPETCNLTGETTLVFSFTQGSNPGCKAHFSDENTYDPTKSTCKPQSYNASTLVFSNDQGISAGAIWSFQDSFAGDFANSATISFICPATSSTVTLTSKTDNKSCTIMPGSQTTLTFTSSLTSANCTIIFDSSGSYTSQGTCKPTIHSATQKQITLSSSFGINDPKKLLTLDYAGGGQKQCCQSGNCKSGVTLTESTLFLAKDLTSNGAMELVFSASNANCINYKPGAAGSTPTQCTVAFYNQFIDAHKTSCKNISVTTIAEGYSENKLSFPANGAGNGKLDIYPVAPASTSTGTQVGSRVLSFDNQCDQDVWFNLVSGTVGAPTGNTGKKGNQCAGGGAITCPVGSTCRYTNDANAYCFYDIAAPSTQTGSDLDYYKLSKSGGTSTVSLPIYQENNVIFSGSASARIGCKDAQGNYQKCSIGNCNADNNALGCGYTQGTGNGATIAEFTFQQNDIDFYDISIINGAHIPISMAPTASQTPKSKPSNIVSDYWCKEPGGTSGAPRSGLNCSWDFDNSYLPSGKVGSVGNVKYYYINVSKPDSVKNNKTIDTRKLNYCNDTQPCQTTGETCGLSLELLSDIAAANRADLFTATGANGIKGPFTCGKMSGYDTPVNICALLTVSDDDYLNCLSTLDQTAPGSGNTVSLTYNHLYACNGPTDNCIKAKKDYQDTVCCGCTVWSDLNKGIKSGQINNKGDSTACRFAPSGSGGSSSAKANVNEHWTGGGSKEAPDIKGKITFLKEACPTAYAYQYDDATSTFNCYVSGTPGSSSSGASSSGDSSSGGSINVTNYTITFCPDGTSIQ